MTECCGCRLEEENSNGCNIKYFIKPSGEKIKRIPYKNDCGDHRCHDCNAKIGEFHHFYCDLERCPQCGGQMLWCMCLGYRSD